MALRFSSDCFSLSILFFLFLSFIPSISSLSTFSISESSNQPLLCSLLPSNSFLNCTSPTFNFNSSFSGIVSGDGFLCSLETYSTSPNTSISIIRCWRFSPNLTIFHHKRIYRGLAIRQLQAGNRHICGIVNLTSQVQCWQWPEFNSITIPNVSSITVGEGFVCGLSETGHVNCTGNNVPESVPSGNYSIIAAGFRNVCGITFNKTLICWGENNNTVAEAPAGRFKGVAGGENRWCALRDINGTAVCWGENGFVIPTALQDTQFISIEAKRRVFCGVAASNFSLHCWSNSTESHFMVFEQVMPGPCTTFCPCGSILPGAERFCPRDQNICSPCWRDSTEPPPSPLTPPPPPPPQLTPQPPPPPQPQPRVSDWNGRMVVLLVFGCFGSLVLVIVCAFFLYRFLKSRGCRVHDSGRLDEVHAQNERSSRPRADPEAQPVTRVLEKKLSQLTSMGNAGHLEEFSLEALLSATNNFSEDHRIGTGSFGSVYRAVLEDGRLVAVKRAEISNSSSAAFNRHQEDKDNAFLNELESLSRLHHKNLVRLLGFCEDCNELVLVYEYMENGTLHDHLHKRQESPLMSWVTRLRVALDAARGIQYLHEFAVPSIIHRDIKSSNILLDATWTAKVSDFGLSLMGPADDESHISLHAAGTMGYMDPEYYRLQKLTTKSDVYSFGVVLLELLSGCRAIHKNENGTPRNVVDYVVPYIVQDEIHRVLDPRVAPPTPYEIEGVVYVGYLATDCVTSEGRDRPSMTEIVNTLEKALIVCSVNPIFSRSSTESST